MKNPIESITVEPNLSVTWALRTDDAVLLLDVPDPADRHAADEDGQHGQVDPAQAHEEHVLRQRGG